MMYKHQFYVMELYIKTLTGTSLELLVSPFDTVYDVKFRIQKLEGIPVSQQHLIWQSEELEDDRSLREYHVYNGATLQLVLSMRGGPVNTRRVVTDEPTLHEMAEYFADTQDDVFSSDHQLPVTYIVYHNGEQLNFFRVVDRDTSSSLSYTLSGSPELNPLEETPPPKERREENDRTREKMQQIRSQMNSMNMNKDNKDNKDKMATRSQVASRELPADPTGTTRPPTGCTRPPTAPRTASRHKLNRLTSMSCDASISSLNRNLLLPPISTQTPTSTDTTMARSLNPLTIKSLESVPTVMTSSSKLSSAIMTTCPVLPRPPPVSQTSSCLVTSARLRASWPQPSSLFLPSGEESTASSSSTSNPLSSTDLLQSSSNLPLHAINAVLPDIHPLLPAAGFAIPTINAAVPSTNPIVLGTSCVVPPGSQSVDTAGTDNVATSTDMSPTCQQSVSAPQVSTADSQLSVAARLTVTDAACQCDASDVSSDPIVHVSRSPHVTQAFSSTVLPSFLTTSNGVAIVPTSVPPIAMVTDSIATVPPSITRSSIARNSVLPRPITAKSVAIMPPPITRSSVTRHLTSEVQQSQAGLHDIPEVTSVLGFSPNPPYRRAGSKSSIKIQSLNIHEVRAMSGMLNSLVRNQSRAGYLAADRTVNNTPLDPLLTAAERARLTSSRTQLRKLSASRSTSRVSSATFRIPSVKLSLRKKSSKRCSFCGKRTRVAMNFQCRCGNNFCSVHRYAETHSCTFDYKAEGRKLLEQSNPVVAAPKLPKI